MENHCRGRSTVVELTPGGTSGEGTPHPARCRGAAGRPAFRINYALRTPKGRHGTDSPAIDGGRIDTASMRMQPGQPRHLMLWLATAAQALTGQTRRHDAGAQALLPASADDGLLRGREPRPHFRGRERRVLVFVHGLRLRQGERLPEGRSLAPTATIAPPPGTRAAVLY